MVQRTQIVLEDDVDGGPADETVKFGLDGVTYEIDLSKDNAEKLRDVLASWIGLVVVRAAAGRVRCVRRVRRPTTFAPGLATTAIR